MTRRLRLVVVLAAIAAVVVAGRDACRPVVTVQAVDLTPAERFARGTVQELQFADQTLARDGGPCSRAGRELIRAQLWFEYGVLPEDASGEGAISAETVSQTRCLDEAVAAGLLAFAAGEMDLVEHSLARTRELAAEGGGPALAPGHRHWLQGLVALASDQATAMQQATAALAQATVDYPDSVALARMHANLYLRAGDGGRALEILTAARAQATHHMGLAADEAIANAVMHTRESGVADLTDQLLTYGPDVLSPPDRARALVARSIVHVHMGERDVGLGKLEQAWTLIPSWDHITRDAALELALEAGDTQRARTWLRASSMYLHDSRQAIFLAWALLADGRLRDALAALASLPQKHPRVAYLQGLALVEQRRMEEAVPWLVRAQKFLPRRVELDVALARASLETGDRKQALRKLQGLAEEEPFAPRALTGLGEAYLAQGDDAQMLGKAHQVLLRAVEVERLPAEAMMQLAELWRRQRVNVPEGDAKALEWLVRATETNPHVPRYRLELALHLVSLGEYGRALPMLQQLFQEPGVDARVPMALARLAIARSEEHGGPLSDPPDLFDTWLQTAEQAGADSDEIVRIQARAARVTGSRRAQRKAVKQLREQLERHPLTVETRVLLIDLLLAQHAYEDAETVLRKGIRLSPDDQRGRLYAAWATIELRTGSPRQAMFHALHAWRRMREEQRPTSELFAIAEMAARLCVRKELDAQALRVVRDFTRMFPKHADGWHLRASIELSLNEASKAKKSIQQAIELRPEQAEYHVTSAKIFARQGAQKKAAAANRRARELQSKP